MICDFATMTFEGENINYRVGSGIKKVPFICNVNPSHCYKVSFTIISISPISGTSLFSIRENFLKIESNDVNDAKTYMLSVTANLLFGL